MGTVRKIIFVIALIVLLISGYKLGSYFWNAHKEESEFEKLQMKGGHRRLGCRDRHRRRRRARPLPGRAPGGVRRARMPPPAPAACAISPAIQLK